MNNPLIDLSIVYVSLDRLRMLSSVDGCVSGAYVRKASPIGEGIAPLPALKVTLIYNKKIQRHRDNGYVTRSQKCVTQY
ncbi:hypothetical protein NIES4075_25790 [Tolypothrix sp. NIES-4075]|uniref:hypothetical protein n=1 Tax=Tolypothrix sp. NIES-4075 TaxID=2005459 RepID=UPI000B66C77B|nr:hypothetical protein [Tolypothrix sp. NIES-4075]GAX41582.1 hypothetical protein NIES4075_25790 [Tolypothrix sp. NIES-4075]